MTTNPSGDLSATQYFEAADMRSLQEELQPFISLGCPPKQQKRSVTLVHWGRSRAKVITCVRDQAKLSLAEAKALVDSAPTEVPIRISGPASDDELSVAIRDAVWALEEAGAEVDASPEEDWRVFPIEPKFLSVFPRLELEPGWEYIAQVYSGPQPGYGRVWAMPPAELSWRDQPDMWRGFPPSEIHSFAETLKGDGTHQSYLEASLLIREMDDLNGRWEGIDWHSHKLISEPSDHNWIWIQEEVFAHSDLRPNVATSMDGKVTVSFFTESRLGQVRLVRHRDRYCPGNYRPETDVLLCATGGQGYVY